MSFAVYKTKLPLSLIPPNCNKAVELTIILIYFIQQI